MKPHPLQPEDTCARVNTPLGEMLLAADAQGLWGAWFTDQADCPDDRDVTARLAEDRGCLAQAITQLREYFAGVRREFDLPLHFKRGTLFQQRVWQALRGIAYGQTSHYAAIALQAGRPAAVRATGGAIGRNPLSIIVPCHRVVGRDGSLTGFSGGLHRKQALLALERR